MFGRQNWLYTVFQNSLRFLDYELCAAKPTTKDLVSLTITQL